MTTPSLSTWRFILNNYNSGFLGGVDTHTRHVYNNLRMELNKYEHINTVNLQPIKDKLNQLHNSTETYLSGNYFNPENKNLLNKDLQLSRSLQRDIPDIAPKNVMRLMSFERFLIKYGLLDQNKNHWDKTYHFLFSIDEKNMKKS